MTPSYTFPQVATANLILHLLTCLITHPGIFSDDGFENESEKLEPEDPTEQLHILKVWGWDSDTSSKPVFYSLNDQFPDCCDGAWLGFTRVVPPFPTMESKETRFVVVEKISAMRIITWNSGKFPCTQSDKWKLPESLVFQEDPEKVVTEKMEHQGNIMEGISTEAG